MALVVSLILIGCALVSAVWIGVVWGSLGKRVGNGWADPLSIASQNSTVITIVIAQRVQLFGGSAVGLWAFVQGIVAVSKNRGRKAGVAALTLAAIAPILLLAASLISYSASLPK